MRVQPEIFKEYISENNDAFERNIASQNMRRFLSRQYPKTDSSGSGIETAPLLASDANLSQNSLDTPLSTASSRRHSASALSDSHRFTQVEPREDALPFSLHGADDTDATPQVVMTAAADDAAHRRHSTAELPEHNTPEFAHVIDAKTFFDEYRLTDNELLALETARQKLP